MEALIAYYQEPVIFVARSSCEDADLILVVAGLQTIKLHNRFIIICLHIARPLCSPTTAPQVE